MEDRPAKTITYFGRSVTFPDLPDQRSFLAELEAGRWDGGGLFESIARYVDPETVYVDIGAWIGVSPFWAAQQAKMVIAVEPDPVCIDVLKAMQELNASPVTVVDAALSIGDELTLHAVGGLGSSLTSAVHGDSGGSFSARGVSLQQLVAMAQGAPLCIKIDIEGYEYHLAEQLAAVPPDQTKAILISLHPRFFLDSQKGGWMKRRLETAKATVRLARALPAFRLRNRQALARVLLSLIFERRPVHRDILFTPA